MANAERSGLGATGNLDRVTDRLAEVLAYGSNEALPLVEFANDLAASSDPPVRFGVVRVDDLDTAIAALLGSAQARKRVSDARNTAARLAELPNGLDHEREYSLEAFGARFADCAERVSLLARSGDLDGAARVVNETLACVDDDRMTGDVVDLLRFELRGDLLWAAADGFSNNELFYHAMAATAAALARAHDLPEASRLSIEDQLALKLAGRALTLAEAGSRPEHNLAQAHAALGRLSDDVRARPVGLNFRLRWALASGNDGEAAKVVRDAQAADVGDALDLAPHRRLGIQLLAALPTGEAWVREFGPFAAPLYSDARAVTLAEAYEFLGEPRPVASNGGVWPPRALLVGRVLIGEADIDVEVLQRHAEIRDAVGRGQLFESDGLLLPARRAVPTASLRTYLTYLGAPHGGAAAVPGGLGALVEVGSRAARVGRDLDRAVASMLRYFNEHRAESEASFACAAILAGVVIELLGPPDSEACLSYAAHLVVCDHQSALDKARRGVGMPGLGA